jgi:hypothetical protein
MVEGHCDCQYEDQPFHPGAEKLGIWNIHVHCPDEHTTSEESSQDIAKDQQENGSHYVRQIAEQMNH